MSASCRLCGHPREDHPGLGTCSQCLRFGDVSPKCVEYLAPLPGAARERRFVSMEISYDVDANVTGVGDAMREAWLAGRDALARAGMHPRMRFSSWRCDGVPLPIEDGS